MRRTRKFEFIPMWGIKVLFVYTPRRVKCPICGIRVERMPWASGKHRLTNAYAWFLASWAKRLKLEGGGRGLPHNLAPRILFGRNGCCLGARA